MYFISLIQLLFFVQPPVSLYDIRFLDIDQRQIDMSAYKGKRLLIYTFNAAGAGQTDFNYLDSLQSTLNDIQIIAIPAVDATGKEEVEVVKRSREKLKSGIIVAYSATIQKRAIYQQHPLMQWLTDKDNNGCFNNDGEAGQYFLISAKGTLHALLQPGSRRSIVSELLRIPFDESNVYVYNPEKGFYEPSKN